MWNVILRGLRARKVRLFLTALSVVLGVSFVAGVFVFTDTLRASFDRVFRATAVDVDLVVRSAGIPGGDFTQRERMHDAVIDVVREVPGVDAADGVVQGIAKLQGRDGEIIQSGLAPTIGLSWPTAQEVGPLRLLDDGSSRAPRGPEEVAVDVATARGNELAVGDEIGVQVGPRPVEPYTIVGIFEFGDVDDLAGATFAAFDFAVAQEGFDASGLIDFVNVGLSDDVSPGEVGSGISAALGPGYEVIDATTAAEELGDPLQEGLGFLEQILLAFAAVGVFVGGFIIFNTFSVLISQRTREIGLLRSLGATNRQVVLSVLAEAFVIGLLAAGIGIALGIALVHLLLGLFPDVGFEVPEGPIVLRARTVLVAAAVGIVVTVASALVPALRAARVAPVVAVGHVSRALSAPSLVRRSVLGAVLLVLGGALVAIGLERPPTEIEAQVGAVALGCFTVFLGVVMVSPAISRLLIPPLAPVPTAWFAAVAGAIVAIGATLRMFDLVGSDRFGAATASLLIAIAAFALVSAVPTMRGVLGTLTRGNAARNPRRTTATASALVLGLTLVCLVAILLSSVRMSLQQGIEEGVEADVVLSAADFAPISHEAIATAAAIAPIDEHAAISFGTGAIAGRSELVAGINPAAFDGVIDLDLRSGSAHGLRDGILVNSVDADRLGVQVGDRIDVALSRFGAVDLPVVGIYENRGFTGSVLVDFIVSDTTFRLGFGDATPATLAFLRAAPDSADLARSEVANELSESYPDVRVQTVAEFQAEQDRAIDLIVNVLLALLAFSLLIAVLGIVNTLLLAVYERTRELGLLRTLGMLPRQVQRMIRGEAMVIAAIGCLFGTLLGLLWGWAFTRTLSDEGVTRLSVPFGQLAVFIVLAGAAGVLASVLPAWRASRLEVLEAVAEE